MKSGPAALAPHCQDTKTRLIKKRKRKEASKQQKNTNNICEEANPFTGDDFRPGFCTMCNKDFITANAKRAHIAEHHLTCDAEGLGCTFHGTKVAVEIHMTKCKKIEQMKQVKKMRQELELLNKKKNDLRKQQQQQQQFGGASSNNKIDCAKTTPVPEAPKEPEKPLRHLCKVWLETGHCPAGASCPHLHKRPDSDSESSSSSAQNEESSCDWLHLRTPPPIPIQPFHQVHFQK